MANVKHPAKFSDQVLNKLADLIPGNPLILDPFGGVGRIHELGLHTVVNEIELPWLQQGSGTNVQGDALSLPFKNCCFDMVITSCVFGNRMSDHHNARDASKRNTYRHTLGRSLHSNNAGRLQFGKAYKEFHERAWREVWRVTKRWGVLYLNISDHIRKKKIVPVTDWHRETLIKQGWIYANEHEVATPRLRYGANHESRVDHETILVFVR